MHPWGWESARTRAAALCVLALALLVAVPNGVAQAREPAAACQLDQLAAARKLYSGSLACWARSFGGDELDALECLAAPEARFVQSYAKAAAKAGKRGASCGLKIRVEALLGRAVQDIDPLTVDLAVGFQAASSDDAKLRSKLQKATAAFASRAFAIESKHAARPDETKRDSAYLKQRTKLASTFAKALQKATQRGVAYAGPDASEVADRVEEFAAYWAALTRPDRPSHTISGTVFAAESTFIDSDVNDVYTDPVFNDTYFAAQPLPVPSTIGGYVNLPGAGADGNSRDSGDDFDTYRVSLRAGQAVVLVLGDDPSLVDLDLCLYGPTIPLGSCSEGIGAVEVVVAPADSSDYYIDVFPFEGCDCGSTYVLSVAQTAPAALLQAARTDVPFVPGEMIVRMMPETGAASASAARALPLDPVAGEPEREMLVRLPATPARRAQTFSALGAERTHRSLREKSAGLTPEEQLKSETLLALKALRGRADVASAELNTIVQPARVPTDPLYALQWHYPMIRLPQAWDSTIGSPNVIVAVVDTGVVLSHPDLQGQLIAGYDFISSASRARDGDGIDADPNDPGDLAYGTGASSFHGTHVAGTIGAASDKPEGEIGVAGVAWGSRVMPIRVLGLQGGTTYDVLQGVRYAAGLPNDSGSVPANRADVINLSLSGGGFSQIAQDLFTEVHDVAGSVVVAAAGNEATTVPSFPASYEDVISVSAVDLNRRLTTYSNTGGAIDVCAPGGDTSVDRNGDSWADGVLSTIASDSGGPLTFAYAFYQGTSMAAPHVAGVIALMKSVNPSLTPAQIDALLQAGLLTEDLGLPGRDDFYGRGLIDASAAVLAAGAAPPDPDPALAVTPSGLNFGVVLAETEILLAKASPMPLSITSIDEDSGGWLSVTPIAVDGDGLGRYRVAVDRTGLAEGTYAASIAIVSSAGTTNVPVVMRVGGPITSDAGFHFVALVDAETLVPLDELGVAAVEGQYAFHFENVPEGDYLLVAGTDNDNDGYICDGGEACGAYPTLDVATPIRVDAELSEADFGTGFRQSIGAGSAAVAPAGASRIIPPIRIR
jgi:serine protease